MAHQHSVYDTDKHFKIDPTTRKIENQSKSKVALIQNDHDSERFTFEIPRYVEEHDMSICNKVEVHYLNIAADNSETNPGVFEVADLQVSPDSEDVVICSWLISRNATKHVGTLHFALRFACLTENVVDYDWRTGVYSEFNISESIFNSEVIVEEYFDILEQWKQEILAEIGGGPESSVSWNDIEDKPFYEFTTQDVIHEQTYYGFYGGPVETFNEKYANEYGLFKVSAVTIGGEYVLAVKGVEYFGVAERTEDSTCENNEGISVKFHPAGSDEIVTTLNSYSDVVYINFAGNDFGSTPADVKLAYKQSVIEPLDPKFLPDTVAMKTDIPEHTWESLPDKPFGKEKKVLWQGDWSVLQNKEMRTINGHVCARVLDSTTIEDFYHNHYYVLCENGSRYYTNSIDNENFVYKDNYTELAYGVYIVSYDYEENGETISAGLWVKADEYYYVGEIYMEWVKELDEKYLPTYIATKDWVNEEIYTALGVIENGAY